MMMQVETGNKDVGRINKLERSSSFSSSITYNSDDSMGKSSPSPTKQACSVTINVSKMQASFAERTASEMEEIVSWYKKYDGIERLQKHNQQSLSMPDNAMIVVDDDENRDDFEEENDGSNNSAYGIRSADQQDDQQAKLQVGDEEFVTVKEYCTPAQRDKSTKPTTSSKKAATSLFSAVQSISKVHKFDDPPPRAIQIKVEDEDGSVISSLSPLNNADYSMKGANPLIIDAVSGDLIRDIQNMEEMVTFRDEEEKVLAMLSPSGCVKLKAQTLIENTDDYNEKEQEVLELLSPNSCRSKSLLGNIRKGYNEKEQDILEMLSPSSCSRNSFFGSSPTGKSSEGQSNDSGDSISTGQEVETQIKAAADVIRNTQYMAEIILQLQQSSSASGNDDSDDDDDDDMVSICNNDVDLDDNSVDASSTFDSEKIVSKNTKSNTIKTRSSGFQVQKFCQFIVPVMLSLVIGLVLRFIKS
jgi:hypothetical protein